MKFKNINPATEEIIGEYEKASKEKVFETAKKVNSAFDQWKNKPISERAELMKSLASTLRENKQEYAETMTIEMGKPIKEAKAEVEKCAWAAEVYAENGEKWLKAEEVEADGKKHLVTFEPLGTILSIMPWNFPFWQAFRFGIPTLLAGNTSVLKHSNDCPESALKIEEAFKKADFPENTFRTVITGHEPIGELIDSDLIQGVSLTGSTSAGSIIGGMAGKNIKPLVLELGGSDPFIVLSDADLDSTAEGAVTGRTLNTGQSCIAAKRFIVMEDVAEEFSKKFAEKISRLKVGNPEDEETDIGPLVNKEQLEQVQQQLDDAVEKGAKLLTGGKRKGDKGYFFEPAILTGTTREMKVISEEVFGPVAPVITVKNEEEAIELANNTEYGLGGSVWTKDTEKGMKLARQIEAGAVFINNIVKSDPRMPFGGIKKSGVGRELSKYGLKEFVNVKTINLYEQ